MAEEIDPRLREHYCFGCGRHNPIGLHLIFEPDGEGVATRYRPRPEDQGFPDVMHGGLLTLLLDEAMSWAMYGDGIFAVTARMETRFRQAVALDAPLTVSARVQRRRGRRVEVEATVSGEAGETFVQASGLFVRMSPEQEAAALETFRASERA